MKKPDGGPAFPQPYEERFDYTGQGGMSLRDYFAGQAMAAYVSKLPIARQENTPAVVPTPLTMSEQAGDAVIKAVADVAYRYADAMIAERLKG